MENKGLEEKWEYLTSHISRDLRFQNQLLNECYAGIKAALTQAEKEHKVLEIIKNKKVNMARLAECETLYEYNFAIDFTDSCKLTQEEFDLLKDWLEQ